MGKRTSKRRYMASQEGGHGGTGSAEGTYVSFMPAALFEHGGCQIV